MILEVKSVMIMKVDIVIEVKKSGRSFILVRVIRNMFLLSNHLSLWMIIRNSDWLITLGILNYHL